MFRFARSTLALCATLSLLALGGRAAPASAREAPETFTPTARTGLAELAAHAMGRSSAVEASAVAMDAAAADVHQAALWPNPAFDFTWGAIPLGESNPPELDNPLLNVPNYSFGLSYLFELGKRGPRKRRSELLHHAARDDVATAAREVAFKAAAALGKAAVASVRQEGLTALLEQARASVALAKVRLGAGHGTPLEVDRQELELGRLVQQVTASQGDRRAALAVCAGLLGMRCHKFQSADEARGYLLAFIGRADSAPTDTLAHRPDARSLQSAKRAAHEEVALARAQRIPDLTVRLGYVRDQFVAAGNQRNSLNLSVSLPLPFFDHGQAKEHAGRARARRLAVQRRRLLEEAHARIPALRRVLRVQRRRRAVLSDEMLPRARAVLSDLSRALGRALVPVSDVIQARQTLNELTLAEADSLNDGYENALDILTLLPNEAWTAPAAAPASGATTPAARLVPAARETTPPSVRGKDS